MGEPIKNKAITLSFDSDRRFGIELEVNAEDKKSRPDDGKPPKGIKKIAHIVQEAVGPGTLVEVRGWEHTDKNEGWVVKPDSSCGIEICSPPIRGWSGIKDSMKVTDFLRRDGSIEADRRCSVHLHVEISDLSSDQIASVLAWWIKCEAVLLDAMPIERKRNRYCQFIGMLSHFQHNVAYSAEDIMSRISDMKYYTCNVYMFKTKNRPTIEFRIAEGAGCLDPFYVKNWIKLLVHFVERTKNLGLPTINHDKNNVQWNGLCWLDTKDVFKVLGFNMEDNFIPGHSNQRHIELSKGLNQVRNWFLSRLNKNMSKHASGGLRSYACKELQEINDRLVAAGYSLGADKHLTGTPVELYGDDFVF